MNRPSDTSPHRRRVLAGAVALGGAAASPALAAGPTSARDLYRKLHYRTDDGLVFWWMRGPKYGVVGATMTPLFNLEVGSIQRVKTLADGGFEVTTLEMVFLSDIDTDRRLTRFRNPYTDEDLPVSFAPVGPSTIRYGADNRRVLPTQIGGARMEATTAISPPLIQGDDVFIRDSSTARVFTPGRTTPFEVNDIAIYHGSLKVLNDRRVTMAPAQVVFAEVTGWQRWLKMGDRPGSMTSRASGAKVGRLDQMPDRWRAMLAEAAPDLAKDPVAALDRPAAKYDR